MKKLIHLQRIEHRYAKRIKVIMPNDLSYRKLVKKVTGRSWSQSKLCWHVPDTEQSIQELKQLFDEVRFQGEKGPPKPPPEKTKDAAPKPSPSSLPSEPYFSQPIFEQKPVADASLLKVQRENETRIKLFVPHNQKSWQQWVKEIPGRAWNQEQKYWSVPLTQEVLRYLKDRWGDALQLEMEIPENLPEQYRPKNWKAKSKEKPEEIKPVSVNTRPSEAPQKSSHSTEHNNNSDNSSNKKLRLEWEKEGRMKAFVPYWKKDWVTLMKSIQGYQWMVKFKYWSLPMTQEVLDFLKERVGDQLQINFKIRGNLPKNSQEKFEKTAKDYLAELEAIAHSKKTPAPPEEKPQQKTPQQAYTPPVLDISVPAEVKYTTYERDGKMQYKIVGETIVCQTNEKQDVFYAFVPFDKKGWLDCIRNIPGRTWMKEEKCWRLPYVKASFKLLQKFVGLKYCNILFDIKRDIPDEYQVPKKQKATKKKQEQQLNETQKKALAAFEQRLILGRYSTTTIKSYKSHFLSFMLYFKDKTPEDVSENQIKTYLQQLVITKKIAESTQNQVINAIKFYFEKVLGHKPKFYDIPRPRKPKKLPNFLSKGEITRLIQAADNLKHKCILLAIYSAGLRKSEVLNLKLTDIRRQDNYIFVQNAKGKKDRTSLLASKFLECLDTYIIQFKPTYWLFEGQYGGQYSASSVQSIFKKAKIKSGINPNATIHWLRHSFATHLILNGADSRYIQQLLGHESSKTTEIYLHITDQMKKKIDSPLDGLDF